MTNAKKLLEQIYSIGGGGLEPLQTNILLQPNTEYYMGASSSPDHIIITKVDDRRIFFYRYPYVKEQMISRNIGTDLIVRGCKTFIKLYKNVRPKQVKNIELLLAGKRGKTVNLNDFKRVRIVAIPADPNVKSGELWRKAEYYGSVGMGEYEKYKDALLIDADMGRANAMKKDKNFKVLKVIDER